MPTAHYVQIMKSKRLNVLDLHAFQNWLPLEIRQVE